MTSTKGITGTGLKKCIPAKFSGLCKPLPISAIDSEDVLDAITASSGRRASTSASTFFFSPRFSTIASTTISRLEKLSKSRVGWLRNALANFKQRLRALEKHVAETGAVLTEAQVVALEKKRDDDIACGECSGQLIPDTVLSFSSATTGAIPPLKAWGRS